MVPWGLKPLKTGPGKPASMLGGPWGGEGGHPSEVCDLLGFMYDLAGSSPGTGVDRAGTLSDEEVDSALATGSGSPGGTQATPPLAGPGAEALTETHIRRVHFIRA